MDNCPTPYLFTDKIWQILDNALDWGISEFDFWNMTLAELERLFESKRRMQKQNAQDKAYFDYKLSDLIGASVARIYKKSGGELPLIEEVYPDIFDTEKMQKERKKAKDKLLAAQFMQFANAHNQKFERKGDAMNE